MSGATRRAEILRTAATVFAEKGIDAATVRDIAAEARILSGSLYHHFDSKEQMVEEILRAGLDELIEGARVAAASHEAPAAALRALIDDGVAFMMANEMVGTIIRNESRRLERSERFAFLIDKKRELRSHMVGVLDRGMATGEFRRDLDPNLTFDLISDAILGTVRYPANERWTSEQIAAAIGEVVVRGLAP